MLQHHKVYLKNYLCGHTTNFRSPDYCFKVIEANKEFSLRTLDRQTVILK